ncbi:MAG: ATP-binding cassette domain-containing protein [Acidobacteriota bacterium]|nr:ATP-binding cassette domain-containing protein [Acidobacteriota bacterium]
MPPLLRFHNITVSRDGKNALDDISLSIDAGENLAIIGPNGCGKSTLIKTITRELYPLARPDSRLELLGRESWNVFDLRGRLGIVTNDLLAASAREITGREAVLSGFFSSTGIWPHQRIEVGMEEKARVLLERLEVPHLSERFISAMSSGEARRVLIGRALAHDPAALILDEPTNSLDIHAMHALRDTMRTLAQTGTSIILVTHHLPDIIPEIERVILIAGGRVWRDGPKRELLRPEVLSTLFRTQLEVVERAGYFHMW